VERAEDWPWSSASLATAAAPALNPGPKPRLGNWVEQVNEPQTEAEVERLHESLHRGRPFGESAWMEQGVLRWGL
jgi:hypothetical protein